MKKGDKVKINTIELSPYFDTSKEFTVINTKPYREYDNWIEIENEFESGIVRVKNLDIISR